METGEAYESKRFKVAAGACVVPAAFLWARHGAWSCLGGSGLVKVHESRNRGGEAGYAVERGSPVSAPPKTQERTDTHMKRPIFNNMFHQLAAACLVLAAAHSQAQITNETLKAEHGESALTTTWADGGEHLTVSNHIQGGSTYCIQGEVNYRDQHDFLNQPGLRLGDSIELVGGTLKTLGAYNNTLWVDGVAIAIIPEPLAMQSLAGVLLAVALIRARRRTD